MQAPLSWCAGADDRVRWAIHDKLVVSLDCLCVHDDRNPDLDRLRPLLRARPGPGYTAATFRSAIEELLDGEGTVTVTQGEAPEYLWTIVITGNNNANLEGAQVIYEDGFYENGAAFVRTGNCD